MPPLRRLIAAPVLLATLAAGGCAVGPDFVTPAPPTAKAYDPAGLPAATVATPSPGGASQTFVAGQAVPTNWWELFQTEPLNHLVAQALANNPDLDAAMATLRQSQENLAATTGLLFPSIDGKSGAQREKISPAGMGNPGGSIPAFTLYNASVNVSYGIDIFGGTRRAVEALEATTDGQRYALEAARLTLAGNVVTTAIQAAALREQIAATQAIAAAQAQQLTILQRQFELGGLAKSSVLAQTTTLAQTQASLPPLQKQLAQTQHLLAALVGQTPDAALAADFELNKLHLPENLPLTLPSQLVADRPDILVAEAQLHAANAQIGVATAALLPQITLNASYGADSSDLGKLLDPESAIWNFGAGLTQPLFRGGQLWHKRSAAQAAFDAAAAQYRSTVLAAFQNVADVLRALQADAEELRNLQAAADAADSSLALARHQHEAGAISFLTLLNAEQAHQQTRLALIQTKARRFADTAALFQALGGGWKSLKTTENSP